MDYAAFKTAVKALAWRTNDETFNSTLDTIILMANAELKDMLHDHQIMVNIETITATNDTWAINATNTPSVLNFKSVLALIYTGSDETAHPRDLTRISLEELLVKRYDNTDDVYQPYFAIENEGGAEPKLYFLGPMSEDTPYSFMLKYRKQIPDFATDDASFLADECLNLYIYTVLKHAASYAREAARVVEYSNMQTDAFNKLDQADKHTDWSEPLAPQTFARPAP